ncbi:CPBP family glutamic-type intramembrane protease [Salinirubrum litoreum]|uniref:Type II CAAX prenyl endopeptidase Rce1 family protein n=1 Tax=Salinirubrum litoreum TaxID=1126234 RepID=A0ABD5RDJ0_9EURY|nr:CPBP family glutamic-type intramembrane protease [Salinirubrum litoreum]
MTEWAAFAGFAGVVTVALLVLAYASQGTVSGSGDAPPAESLADRSGDSDRPRDPPAETAGRDPQTAGDEQAGVEQWDDPPGVDPASWTDSDDATGPTGDAASPGDDSPEADEADELTARHEADGFEWVASEPVTPAWLRGEGPEMTSGLLLANVLVSQGLFAGFLLFGAWFTDVPASAFGVTSAPLSTGLPAIAVGIGVGLLLYLLNELGAGVGDRLGVTADESLRELLAPDTRLGWVVLLVVVLPIVAGFEEFLFRGALIGVVAVGFDVSPWLLAALSSVAFALGHGAQGPGGILVTGLLGFALAVTFVLTGSLLAVIVAHYLVNALEFVVHEGLDLGS